MRKLDDNISNNTRKERKGRASAENVIVPNQGQVQHYAQRRSLSHSDFGLGKASWNTYDS